MSAARYACILLFGEILSASATEPESSVQVYFSPGVSCTVAIVREIGQARQTVHVQAYSFTSQPVARALTDAEKRGVKVIAILDASNRTKKYSAADFLADEGIETYLILNTSSRTRRLNILVFILLGVREREGSQSGE